MTDTTPPMELKRILIWPDETLHKVSAEVTVFDDELASLAASMLATMSVNRGYGISAVQIGDLRRVMICIVNGVPDVLVNPVITSRTGELKNWEGCLSVPGFNLLVTRAENVVVVYKNLKGEEKSLDTSTLDRQANLLTAACIQHEIDHMNGVLFVDNISEMKRNMAREKIKKFFRAQRKARK